MRILLISGSPPYPPHIGGNQLAAHLLRALSLQGEVDLFLALEPDDLPPPHIEKIRSEWNLIGMAGPSPRGRLGRWRRFRPLHPGTVDRLADLFASRQRDYTVDLRWSEVLRRAMARQVYDVVVAGGLPLAMKSGLPPDYPIVLNVNDVEREWFESQVHSPATPLIAKFLAWWRLHQVQDTIPDLYRRFRHCWVIKDPDKRIEGLEHAVWLGVPFTQSRQGWPSPAASLPASRVVIMLGSYYHRPNAEGLDWFVRRVWGKVKANVPDAEFRIIGPGLPVHKVRQYGCRLGIRILGTVPDVAPHYRCCALAIAPIWMGAGINLKVMDAYAHGRACVATPFAYRGYEDCLEQGRSIRVAGNPEEFASACIELLREPAHRDQLAAEGQARILEHFSFERFSRVAGETCSEAIRTATKSGSHACENNITNGG